jgi:hypothetical protein
MFFQIDVLFFNTFGAIISVIAIILIISLLLLKLESKEKVLELKYMILLSSFIIVLFLPLFLGIINLLFEILGDLLKILRFDHGGNNYLIAYVPIMGLLLILSLIKYILNVNWEKSLWISLPILFTLYVIYSLVPEFFQFIGFGL